MIPTSQLNSLGQQFEKQCTRAWELFEAERFDEANAISHRLVDDPRVGDLHKAGCHMILAHSPDNYVYVLIWVLPRTTPAKCVLVIMLSRL